MSKVHPVHVVNDDWAMMAVNAMKSLGFPEKLADELEQDPPGCVKQHLEDMAARGLLTKQNSTFYVRPL